MKAIGLIPILLSVMIAGCQTSKPEYRTQISKEHNVSALVRYTWRSKNLLSVVGSLIGGNNQLLESRLRSNVSRVLEAKGYKFVEPNDDPQIEVSFVAGLVDQESTSYHTVGGEPVQGEANQSWVQTNDIVRGGVSVILKVPGEDHTLWKGTAIELVKNRQLRKQDGTAVRQMVDKIMQSLPASM
ncbi:MAG: DUF4136 domain-containing protein [Pseudomonadales bacterium]|nr:DUF4136 domain-containing protein [Pseudomonadales bacterium]